MRTTFERDRLLAATLATLHAPGAPFTPEPGQCRHCAALIRAEESDLAAEAEAERTGGDYPAWDEDAWMSRQDALELHGDLHRSVQRTIAAHRGDPEGRQVLVEPGEGVTEQSKAFFLLHRHLFGTFISATMGDYERAYCLRLYDDVGQVLELRGCTAGYGGEGPHGTLTILRWAGFSDADAAPATLERLALGRETFLLTRLPEVDRLEAELRAKLHRDEEEG
jgi:hypothetical protein